MFGLPEWHKSKKRYDVFIDIIDKHLNERYSDHERNFKVDKTYNRPTYVVNMIKELHKELKNSDTVDIDDVFYLDTYNSGHVDYAYKFSLHLTELEDGYTLRQITRPWES